MARSRTMGGRCEATAVDRGPDPHAAEPVPTGQPAVLSARDWTRVNSRATARVWMVVSSLGAVAPWVTDEAQALPARESTDANSRASSAASTMGSDSAAYCLAPNRVRNS